MKKGIISCIKNFKKSFENEHKIERRSVVIEREWERKTAENWAQAALKFSVSASNFFERTKALKRAGCKRARMQKVWDAKVPGMQKSLSSKGWKISRMQKKLGMLIFGMPKSPGRPLYLSPRVLIIIIATPLFRHFYTALMTALLRSSSMKN